MVLSDIGSFLIGIVIVVVIACILAAPVLWIWNKFEKKRAEKLISKNVRKEVEDESITEEIKRAKFKELYDNIAREGRADKENRISLETYKEPRGSIISPGVEEESDERGRMEIPTATLPNRHKKRIKLHHPTDTRPQPDSSS